MKLKYHLSLMIVLIISCYAKASWVLDPFGGPNFDFIVADSSGEKILAEIMGSGIWMTEDGGQNWSPVHFSSYMGSLTNIDMYDANGDTLFLQITANHDSLTFLSFNGGESWSVMQESFSGAGFNIAGEHLIIDTNNPDQWYFLNDQYFARSQDGGESWNILYTDNTYNQKESLILCSQTDELFITSIYIYTGQDPNYMEGVSRSNDNGGSWENIFNMHELFGNDDYNFKDVIKLSENIIVLCGSPLSYADGWDDGNVFISENNGESWERIFGGVAQRFMPEKLLLDFAPNDIYMIGDQKFGIYKSEDGGYHWSRVLQGLPENVFRTGSIWQNRFSGTIYLAANGFGGFFKTTVSEEWELISAPNLGSPGNMLFYDNDYYCLHESKQVWKKTGIEGDWHEIALPVAQDTLCTMWPLLFAGGDTLIARYYQRPFYDPVDIVNFIISTDGGESWTPYVETPFYTSDAYIWQEEYGDSTYIYASTMDPVGLMISSDLGLTWRRSDFADNDYASRLVVGDSVICRVGNRDIYLSYDNCESWEATNHPGSYLGWPSSPIMINDDEIFVRSDDLYWRWHNNTWSVQGEYPYDTYTTIAVPRDEDTVFVANGFDKIWLSDNYGASWHVLDEPFPYPGHTHMIERIYFDENAEQIWISTSIGLCHLPISNLSMPEKQASVQPDVFLFDAYPNPFNASLTITYNLPNSKPAKARIYNVVGKLVKEIDLPSTKNEYVVDMSTWASGAYFLVVQTDSQVQTKKVMMVK